MRKAMNLFLLGGLSLLLAAGCDKFGGEQQYSRAEGEPVIFGVTSGAGTKTAYSGDVTDGVERINWSVGDDFRIYSDKAVHRYHSNQKWADYVVTKATPNGRYSNAEIDNKDTGEKLSNGQPMTNGLVWGAAGTYNFWAVYPAPAETTASSTLAGLKLNIPATQDPKETSTTDGVTILTPDMANAFMTAVAANITTSDDTGAPVNLDFEPAFTAFEFTMSSDENTIKLNTVTLESASKSLAGDFSVSYSGTTPTYTDENAADAPSKSITINLGGQEIAPATESAAAKTVTFTFLAQPQAFNDLKISFTIESNGESQTRSMVLAKDGDGVEFAALKKHILRGTSMPSELFKIYYKPQVVTADEWVEIGETTDLIVM